MIKKIKNVIKGNLYYWNTTHNEKAVNVFYKKFNSLSEEQKEIAIFTLSSASSLLSFIIGPERKNFTSKRISDRQMKSLTSKDHIDLLMLCFEMFSRVLCLSDEKNSLTQADQKIFGNTYLLKNNLDNQTLKNIIFQYGRAIADRSRIIDKNDPTFNYSFFALVTEYTSKIVDQEAIIRT